MTLHKTTHVTTHAERPTRDNDDLIASRKKNLLPTAFLYHKVPLQLVRAKGRVCLGRTGQSLPGCHRWHHLYIGRAQSPKDQRKAHADAG